MLPVVLEGAAPSWWNYGLGLEFFLAVSESEQTSLTIRSVGRAEPV
jgi:hypothetical protein